MRARRALGLALITLLGLAGLSLLLGASGLPPGELLGALLSGDKASRAYRIVVYVRLPRLIAACMAGASLAASGMLLQSVLRNPLASPGLIGVNAGAGLLALIAMVAWPHAIALVPVAAFLGALCAACAVYALAALVGASKNTLILSGVAVSSLLGAAMDALVTLTPDAVPGRSAFAIGGFTAATLPGLAWAAPFMLGGLLIALRHRRELSILSLGDEVAHGLGLNVARFRAQFLCAAALLAGAAVSVAGLVGFVGLIAPHACRALVGEDEKASLPLCIVFGAALCVACDLIARTAFAPFELPVGILLSGLGCPFFLYLLYRQRKGNRHDAH